MERQGTRRGPRPRPSRRPRFSSPRMGSFLVSCSAATALLLTTAAELPHLLGAHLARRLARGSAESRQTLFASPADSVAAIGKRSVSVKTHWMSVPAAPCDDLLMTVKQRAVAVSCSAA